MDIELIALGKKSGLSLIEINEFRISDLFDFTEAYMVSKEGKSRKATQTDIDAFYAN